MDYLDCSLHVGGKVLSQGEEFNYFGVLFVNEGKMECETDRWTGAASTVLWTWYVM